MCPRSDVCSADKPAPVNLQSDNFQGDGDCAISPKGTARWASDLRWHASASVRGQDRGTERANNALLQPGGLDMRMLRPPATATPKARLIYS